MVKRTILLPGYVWQVAVAPHSTRRELVQFCGDWVRKATTCGGVVRNIFNHGVGQTPFRFKARGSTTPGDYHNDARLISFTIFANPSFSDAFAKMGSADFRVIRSTLLRDDKAVTPKIGESTTHPVLDEDQYMEAHEFIEDKIHRYTESSEIFESLQNLPTQAPAPDSTDDDHLGQDDGSATEN